MKKKKKDNFLESVYNQFLYGTMFEMMLEFISIVLIELKGFSCTVLGNIFFYTVIYYMAVIIIIEMYFLFTLYNENKITKIINKINKLKITCVAFPIIATIIILLTSGTNNVLNHKDDAYYIGIDNEIYYEYDDMWYNYDYENNTWYQFNEEPNIDEKLGKEYSTSYDVTDFKESEYYKFEDATFIGGMVK